MDGVHRCDRLALTTPVRSKPPTREIRSVFPPERRAQAPRADAHARMTIAMPQSELDARAGVTTRHVRACVERSCSTGCATLVVLRDARCEPTAQLGQRLGADLRDP